MKIPSYYTRDIFRSHNAFCISLKFHDHPSGDVDNFDVKFFDEISLISYSKPSSVAFELYVNQEFQEWFCDKYQRWVRFIANLNPELANKYSHLIMADKFGLFNEKEI